jgi:hypothetical protein
MAIISPTQSSATSRMPRTPALTWALDTSAIAPAKARKTGPYGAGECRQRGATSAASGPPRRSGPWVYTSMWASTIAPWAR